MLHFPLWDAHTHLDAPPPEQVAAAVIGGTTPARAEKDLALARSDPRLRVAAGLHPWFLPEDDGAIELAVQDLRPLLHEPGVVALGECGLDRGRRAAPWLRQERAFMAQLALLAEHDLPLVLHCVRAHDEVLEALPESSHGIVHDFSSGREHARRWVERGFHLSLSPRSLGRLDVVTAIAPEQLLLESDDAGADALRALLLAVAERLREDPEVLSSRLGANLRRAYGWPEGPATLCPP
jgi:TatD DNase family protein